MPPTHPPRLPPAFAALGEQPAFIYVKVPVHRRSVDPLHEREDQIDQALRAQALGSVLSWGESLGDPRADGTRKAAFTRIDISAPALDAALAALQAFLPSLEAMLLTEIHYTRNGLQCMDVLTPGGWQQGLPSPSPRGAGTQ
jgi:hypothetical protein